MQENKIENAVWKMAAILSRSQSVKLKPGGNKINNNTHVL